jgi:hypothetical protein
VEPNTIDEGQRLDKLDARGNWQYPSGAESGHIEIMVPSLPGSPRATETLHARNLGQHIIGKIESAMSRQGYMTSGAQQSPAQVFQHYTAVAKGSKLVEADAISHMERLAREFAGQKGEDRQKYLDTMVKPYLLSLTPKRRR